MTRVGFFARADNGGLGAESWEFVRNFNPEKILVIRGEHGHYPERFTGYNCQHTDGIPSHADLVQFLQGIDVLFSIETFYNWGVIPMARERGIKTFLRVNYEMNLNQVDENTPKPDHYIFPSSWHFNDATTEPKTLLPFPINRKVLPFKQKDKVERFYHVAGHEMFEDRNGTATLFQAMQYIRTTPPITILSQHPLPYDFSPYPFVTVNHQDFENYWDVHQGDCLILPRRFGGQTLQMNEALSLGNPVIMPNVSPQNEFLPLEMLFQSNGSRSVSCHGAMVDCYSFDPQELARAIDEAYGKDISQLSSWANQWANTMSWEALLPKYKELLNV